MPLKKVIETTALMKIEALINDNDLEEAAKVLRRQLHAQVRVRKSTPAGVRYEDVPDNKAQLTAVKLMLDARFARRSTVTLEDNRPALNGRTILEEIQSDPEFRTALERVGAQYVASLPATSSEVLDVELDA